MSTLALGAAPQSADPAAKTTSAHIRTGRRPKTSASLPQSGSTAVAPSANADPTQDSSGSAMLLPSWASGRVCPRLCVIVGSAVDTDV